MIYLLGVNFVFSLLSLNVHSFLLYFCTCYRIYFTQLQLTVFLIYVFLSFVFYGEIFAKCIVVVIIIMTRKQKQPHHFSFHPCPFNVLLFHSVIDLAKLNFAQGLDGFGVMLYGIVKNVACNCQKCWME